MIKQKIVSKQNWIGENPETLIDMLASKDGMVRQKARKSLVAMGKPAVSLLIKSLQNSNLDHVRWEAAKALGAICDTRAIPTLVKALEDKDHDIAWLAAIALKKFKKAAWPTLLQALINSKPDSVLLCQGAHHVFQNQKEDGLNDLLAALTKTLKSDTVPGSMIVTAHEILRRMETDS
jgi:HEAT repeat protein